ncbi:hypothetical protein HWV62_3256 [Athelia sp. TMB]|nr:hypothetical protein HWV62_3256 [Athelia sp. TMB]
MPAPARPIGPRSIPRSVSPAPHSLPDQQHHRRPSGGSGLSLSISPTPPLSSSPGRSLNSLKLQIPGVTAPRPVTPKGLPALQIPKSNGAPTNGYAQEHSPSSAFETGGYYGGPLAVPPELSTDSPGEVTMRPPSRVNPKPDTIEDIEKAIGNISLRARGSSQEQVPSLSNIAQEEVSRAAAPTYSDFNDAVLEELSRLGEGAGGAVHEVRDKRSGFVMARKTITTREAPMKQLLRELDIIQSTMHPNIVLFYGAYMSPSSSEVKILMELCPGKSLEAVGKRIAERGGRVSEKVAGRLAEGVLQGLAYLHSKRTIHRDIKPANILLSREGVVKLGDFGVSGELVDSWAGTFTGTSFYMAPERIQGHEYTIRADVWSTGITLLELVQKRFPFPSDVPPIELIMYIIGEPPRLEDEPEADCFWSAEMKDFIKQTLIVDAATRPAPRDMLLHPWIVNVMKAEVPMARWIRQVWDWPKDPARKTKKP